MSYFKRVKVENSAGSVIDPATEAKQDEAIVVIEDMNDELTGANGTLVNIEDNQTSGDQKTEISANLTPDFLIQVALGLVPGYSSVNKFGHNPAVATAGEDIWTGGGDYDFFPTTAQAMEVSSSSSSDSAAGTGARTVILYGLDENWEEQSETVTLNGTTPVALANTYIRMFRGVVLTAGTASENLGDIEVEASVGGETAIFITAGDGQTQQAIYTIPAGKTGLFVKGYVAMSNDNKNGEDAGFKWLMKLNNGLNGAWQTKGQIGLVNIGTSNWQYEYGIPAGMIPEKTDIRIRCYKASATIEAEGGFDLLLKDN